MEKKKRPKAKLPRRAQKEHRMNKFEGVSLAEEQESEERQYRRWLSKEASTEFKNRTQKLVLLPWTEHRRSQEGVVPGYKWGECSLCNGGQQNRWRFPVLRPKPEDWFGPETKATG